MNMLKKKKVYENDSESYDNKSVNSSVNSSISPTSNESIEGINNSKIEQAHNYYVNKINTESDNNLSFKNTEYKNTDYKNTEYKNGEIQSKNMEKNNKKCDFKCELCDNNSNKDIFFILSCDHIYHIQCLADTHFEDIYKYSIIDNEYFSNRKCNKCHKNMQLDEIMYLHGKYLNNTKGFIERHQDSIESLEYQLKKIKDELRICYDYKHKLEQQREKSKQIVSILSTMVYN